MLNELETVIDKVIMFLFEIIIVSFKFYLFFFLSKNPLLAVLGDSRGQFVEEI